MDDHQARPGYRPWPVEHVVHIPNHDFWAYPNIFYNYQKLETLTSFRLLKLERSTSDQENGYYYTLIHTKFGEAPVYETLSYVWGTTERDVPISLKDGKLLRITKPLKQALSHIERQCTTGYIWIDQICIDQDDSAERGHQVKVMGQIYSSCSRVIVWLGTVGKLGGQSQQSVFDNPNKALRSQVLRSFSRLGRSRKSQDHIESSSQPVTSDTSDERLACLNCLWFQRAWVFQEIVLPPEACFVLDLSTSNKVSTMSLPSLNWMITREERYLSSESGNWKIAQSMYNRWRERRSIHSGINAPIEETLSLLTPRAQTSEQLDRLYAFFGLNTDPSIDLTPSYKLSFEEAMIATIVSIIKGTKSLDIFELIPRVAKPKSLEKSSLPSWTPDFREEQLVIPFTRPTVNFYKLAIEKRLWDATRAPQILTEFRPVIQVHGFQLDHFATEIGTILAETMTEQVFQNLLNRCLQAYERIAVEHKRKHLMVARSNFDFQSLHLQFAGPPTIASLFRALYVSDVDLSSFSPTAFNLKDGLREVRNRLPKAMQGRSLWITWSGRLAIGSCLRRGDEVVLTYGCCNLTALRKYNGAYFVLGTCFLEEWMDPWSMSNVTDEQGKFRGTVGYIR